MMTEKHNKDRGKTKERIIHAIHELLVAEGCPAIGINRIAKQAGVDKVLIYRYFDGLEGALRAYAESDMCWPSTNEIIGGSPLDFTNMDRAQTRSTIMKNALKALRARPHTVSLLAWELVSDNELTAILRDLRARHIAQIMEIFRGDDGKVAPSISGIDLLLSAAIHYLAVTDAGIKNHFKEVQTATGLGWDAIDDAIDHICAALEEYEVRRQHENSADPATAVSN